MKRFSPVFLSYVLWVAVLLGSLVIQHQSEPAPVVSASQNADKPAA